MNFTLIGLPAFIFLVGFVVVFSMPVWVAARITGARHPGLMRAVASLAVGVLSSFLLAMLTGPWVIVLAPVAFLLAFKYILGTSLLGSIWLAVVAGLGYAAMGYFILGSFTGVPIADPGIVV